MADKKPAAKPSRIVAAVGSGASHAKTGGDPSLSAAIQAAMAKAVADALAGGVSIEHSDELRRRQLAARQAVLDQFTAR